MRSCIAFISSYGLLFLNLELFRCPHKIEKALVCVLVVFFIWVGVFQKMLVSLIVFYVSFRVEMDQILMWRGYVSSNMLFWFDNHGTISLYHPFCHDTCSASNLVS